MAIGTKVRRKSEAITWHQLMRKMIKNARLARLESERQKAIEAEAETSTTAEPQLQYTDTVRPECARGDPA